MRTTPRPALLLLLLPLLLALGCDGFLVAQFGVPQAGGGLPVTVFVNPGVDPADVQIALDGGDVRGLFAPGPDGLVGALPLPAPGQHELTVSQPGALHIVVTHEKFFDVPAPAPALASVTPSAASIPGTS